MKKIIFSVIGIVAIIGFGTVVLATHSWVGYHWGSKVSPFTLQLGDNVSTAWDSYLWTTSTDWTSSDVLDTVIVAGKGGRNCAATNGRVEVCNKKYGNNGWLGLAQIWVSDKHITQGVVKVNDTYFSTEKYNTLEWKNLVMCQEVGHTLGLGHNDEDFSTTNGTCMDYSNDPVPNQHPNAHDYEQLVSIYGHTTDTINTVGTAILSRLGFGSSNNRSIENVDFGDSREWGKSIKTDSKGKSSLYERDLGNGGKLQTFVVWAE